MLRHIKMHYVIHSRKTLHTASISAFQKKHSVETAILTQWIAIYARRPDGYLERKKSGGLFTLRQTARSKFAARQIVPTPGPAAGYARSRALELL